MTEAEASIEATTVIISGPDSSSPEHFKATLT
jgi:hypothetical protein